MIHEVNADFINICREIIAENKTIEEWIEIESDDMFQKGDYVGGFDGTEEEFCFSVYIDGKEYWFQVSLEKVAEIAFGETDEVNVRIPN